MPSERRANQTIMHLCIRETPRHRRGFVEGQYGQFLRGIEDNYGKIGSSAVAMIFAKLLIFHTLL